MLAIKLILCLSIILIVIFTSQTIAKDANFTGINCEFEVVPPELVRSENTTYTFYGYLKDYLTAVSENWLRDAPEKNPNIVEVFAHREDKPFKWVLPWYGEFAGKYLVGAVQVMRLTGDPVLKDNLAKLVNRMVELQTDSGYLGP